MDVRCCLRNMVVMEGNFKHRILKHKGEKGFGLDEKECDTWASSCDFCHQTSDWWGFQYRDWLLSCLPRKIYHYKWILYKNRKISNFIFNKHLQLWCICSSHTDVMWALSASERISSSWWKLMKWNETVCQNIHLKISSKNKHSEDVQFIDSSGSSCEA